jgi:hypothetical protein
VQEWDAWSKFNWDDDRSFRFFEYLLADRPYLLNFDYPGDRWMIVQAWLMSTGRLDGDARPKNRHLAQLLIGKPGHRSRQHSA